MKVCRWESVWLAHWFKFRHFVRTYMLCYRIVVFLHVQNIFHIVQHTYIEYNPSYTFICVYSLNDCVKMPQVYVLGLLVAIASAQYVSDKWKSFIIIPRRKLPFITYIYTHWVEEKEREFAYAGRTHIHRFRLWEKNIDLNRETEAHQFLTCDHTVHRTI